MIERIDDPGDDRLSDYRELRDAAARRRIEGDEMFVVIDGELLASVATERGRVRFGTMGRGAVIGEVALFHGKRTADDGDRVVHVKGFWQIFERAALVGVHCAVQI